MKKIIGLTLMMSINYPLYADDDSELENEIRRLREEKKLWIETVSKQKETKDAAAGVVSVITQEEIKRYGGRNLADVVNRVTSMYVLGSHAWTNSVAAERGDISTLLNNHTLVLLDGRPLRDSWHGGLNHMVFQDFPLHQIEQIEVVRGSGSVLYGSNAFSAVINIITKKNKDNALTVRGRYGSFDTGQAETEFAWKNTEASVTGAARYRDTRGWQVSAIDEKNTPITFRENGSDVSAALSGQWGDFTLNTFVADMQSTHWGALPIDNGEPFQYRRLFVDAGHKAEINSHWNFQSNFTYNNVAFTLDTAPGAVSDLQHLTENDLLVEQTHFFSFFDKSLTFLIGGLVEWQTGTVAQPKGVTSLLTYGFLRSSLYGELTYAILDNLKFTAGGKWNRTDDIGGGGGTSSNGQVGRLALVYEINANFGAKILYNQAYRSPSGLETKVNIPSILVGNSSLEPERVEGIDAQVFYHAADYQASLTAFRSRQSGLIVRSTPHRRLAALILHHQRLANISPTKRLSECFVEKHNEL